MIHYIFILSLFIVNVHCYSTKLSKYFHRKPLFYITSSSVRTNHILSKSRLLLSDENDFEVDNGKDMFGDDVNQDSETLERLRLEKIIANDRWQSCSFRDDQGGLWNGIYQVYKPILNSNNELVAAKIESGIVSTCIQASPYTLGGVDITMFEDYQPSPIRSSTSNNNLLDKIELLAPSNRKLLYPSTKFRTSFGNQMVANAFTLSECYTTSSSTSSTISTNDVDDSNIIPDVYSLLLSIREGNLRTRVRYVYTRSIPSSSSQTSSTTSTTTNTATTTPPLMSTVEKQQDDYDLILCGFTVIRELYVGSTSDDSIDNPEAAIINKQNAILPMKIDYDEDILGNSVYDPQASGEPYVELKMPGKLTLFFPKGFHAPMSPSNQGVLCIEWCGKEMRYQIDRKFTTFINNAINTLELTEIRTDDAVNWPPGFPEPPKYLK